MADSSVLKYIAASAADLEQKRQKLFQHRALGIFSDPLAEITVMDAFMPLVQMGGVDIKDFYVFSSIVNDRRGGARFNRPAILFSTNKEEFAPGKKIEGNVYRNERMVWRPDFQLVAGMKDWANAFP